MGQHPNDAEKDRVLLQAWAGQALSVCSGTMSEYDLQRFFEGRSGVTRAEIIAVQSFEIAQAMLVRMRKQGQWQR